MAWHGMYHEKARWLVQVKHRCFALTPPVVTHSTRWVVGSAPIYIVRGALCVYTAVVRVARCDLITLGDPLVATTSSVSGECRPCGPCDDTRAFGVWRAARARLRRAT